MASRVRKSAHLRGKSYSAPSTPGRTFLPDGRQMTADSPSRDIPTAQEKPVPNYLKPTLSSGHDTSTRYGPKSQPEDPVTAAAARKRLLSTKSMEKPASPPSLPHKTSKEKIVPEKESKVPTSGKTLTRAKSFPKNMLMKRSEVSGSTSTTSAIKLEQEDKVLSIDSGVQGHAARRVSRSPKSNSDGKHWTTTEKSDIIGKPGAPRVKVMTKVSGNGVPRKLKGRELGGEGKVAVGERLRSKQSGEGVKVEVERKTERENLVFKWKEVREKDAPPSYNDAIEETATKMAMRRGNVKALVGTFESVIVLQEPQSQPSQQQEEVVVTVGRVDQPSQPKPEKEVKVGEEDAGRGQPRRMKPEKEKEVEGGEEFAKRGSTAKQQPKKEVKNEEESSEGGHLGQETRQKETKGEEENGIEAESKRGQLGQESQQKGTGTEEEKSKGEEGDIGAGEEDGKTML